MDKLTQLPKLLLTSIVVMLMVGCGGATNQPTMTRPTWTAAAIQVPPTATQAPPTATQLPPTTTPVPPTPIPLPPISSGERRPATHTVCASGCDFTTLQKGINSTDDPDAIVELLDPIHTEAGIVVSRTITIRGLGPEQSIVQAHETAEQAADRVFLIEKGISVTLEGLTIRHGRPAVQEDKGGGIENYGSLTLRNCRVSDNTANGGGGISNHGQLTLINSTVIGNTADGIAPMGLECGNGGGIQCGSGTLMLVNSTVSGNLAGVKGRNRGGGIHIGCSCDAILVNSTVSGNRASHESGRTFPGGQGIGGGIFIVGSLQMVNCTVSGNRSSASGGGVFIRGRLDLVGTIIANNRGKDEECFLGVGEEPGTSGIGTNIYNLVGDGSCSPAYAGNPMLGQLADNGGPTMTAALLPGSPAIDAMPAASCPLTTDQRGELRPAPAEAASPACDVGAFELQP